MNLILLNTPLTMTILDLKPIALYGGETYCGPTLDQTVYPIKKSYTALNQADQKTIEKLKSQQSCRDKVYRTRQHFFSSVTNSC